MLLKEGGIQAVSARKVAAEIDVAPRALYNHFENLAALMAGLAAQGFTELSTKLSVETSKQGFRQAYLYFALENPNLYMLMMAQPKSQTESHVDLSESVHNVISVSLEIFGSAARSSEENKHEVMREWMQLHGGVALYLNGILETRTIAEFIEEMSIISNK